jgi:hypothetical protein
MSPGAPKPWTQNPDAVRPWLVQVLQFAHGALCDLADVPGRANAALGLLLAAATAASQEARQQLIAYEFFEQARTQRKCSP